MTAVVEICVDNTLELRHAIIHVDGREECLLLRVGATVIAGLTLEIKRINFTMKPAFEVGWVER